MKESNIQNGIRLKLSTLKNNLMLRYTVGTFMTMDGRTVKVGQKGVSDLIGVISHTVTPEDVGKTIGIFCAMETKQVKDGTAKDRKEQQGRFLSLVNALGGIAGIVRSDEDAIAMVSEKWNSQPVRVAPKHQHPQA